MGEVEKSEDQPLKGEVTQEITEVAEETPKPAAAEAAPAAAPAAATATVTTEQKPKKKFALPKVRSQTHAHPRRRKR